MIFLYFRKAIRYSGYINLKRLKTVRYNFIYIRVFIYANFHLALL